MRDEALAGHHDQPTQPADLPAEVFDLPHDRVGIASKKLAVRDQAFGVDVTRRPAAAGAPRVHRHFGTDLARQEPLELYALLEADGDKPADLFGDTKRCVVSVAHVTKPHIGEAVLASRGQPGFRSRSFIRVECLPCAIETAEYQGVDHTPAA